MTSNEIAAPAAFELLTEAEAAAFLRLKPDTLRAWRTREKHVGRGPAYLQKKRCTHVRYLRADLIDWLLARRQQPSPPQPPRQARTRITSRA